jgi:hypothetical protein
MLFHAGLYFMGLAQAYVTSSYLNEFKTRNEVTNPNSAAYQHINVIPVITVFKI